MSRPGPKRGRDNVYEAVKGQYGDPMDEERLALRTPQACCIHCNKGQTRNTSEMHWHLCVCAAFGAKEPSLQAMLRTCVPDSILRSQKKKALCDTWLSASGQSRANEEALEAPHKMPLIKKAKFSDSRSLSEEVNKLIAKWALMYQIPCGAIDSPEFRDILQTMNPDLHKLPDKHSLSGTLIDVLYEATHAQVSEHFVRSEGLHLLLPSQPLAPPGNEASAAGPNAGNGSAVTMVEVFDGRGTFFYRPVTAVSRRATTHPLRVLETSASIAELPNSAVVSVQRSNGDYSEEQTAQVNSVVQAIEAVYPHKTFLTVEPFSPLACAQLMLSNIAAVHQAVNHTQCVLQYLEASNTPGRIVRSVITSNSELRGLGTAFLQHLELPEDNSVLSVSAMLNGVCAVHQAGLFHRLLTDGLYQNYCRTLSDHSAAQMSLSVQSILVSDVAMAGIEQAALALQLFLTAATKSARRHCATHSDALAVRDALLGAVNKASRLSLPWQTMIAQVVASQWDHSYHALVALACKVDPRRRFEDLTPAMEVDAQRMRDKLTAHLEPAHRKAVIDSWVQMLKRTDCFGDPSALDNASQQSPLDWWLAYAAAHRQLREFVVFPALSALGVHLPEVDGSVKSDPTAKRCGSTFDVRETVESVGLSEDLLRNPDLVEKLAYVRRNCWSLHRAHQEGSAVSKRQYALLVPGDLMSAEFSSTEAQHAPQHHSAAVAVYPAMEDYAYGQDGGTVGSSSSGSGGGSAGHDFHSHGAGSFMTQQHRQEEAMERAGSDNHHDGY